MKTNRVIAVLLIMFVASASLYAKRVSDGEETDESKYGFTEKQEFPFDKTKQSIPPYVQEKRFKLGLSNNKVREIRKNLEKHSEIMEGTLDISILQKPLIKTLKTVDTLYLHPTFISTVLLPKQLTIADCLPSFETTTFSYSQNVLRIQPSKNAKTGNLSLSVTDGKKNYVMNIFVKKYFKEDKCINNGTNYVCADDVLSTIIKYVPSRKLNIDSKLQIMEEYLKLTKKTKISIKNNLDYVTLEKGNETFYIVRDDEFGDIFRNGIAFTIKNAIN